MKKLTLADYQALAEFRFRFGTSLLSAIAPCRRRGWSEGSIN